jgi:outer membrane receptor for ferrienterochelin and colicin
MKQLTYFSLASMYDKIICITNNIVIQLVTNYQMKYPTTLWLRITGCLRGMGCLGWFGLVAAGLLPGRLLAQGPGEVSGILRDQRTRQPLPFASVLLLRLSDSTLIGNTQTAENGTFALTHLVLGRYVVRAEALGYQSARRPATLDAATPVVRLGEWLAVPTAVQLGSVVVQGEKATMVNELGKIVLNVDKDLNSAGGTAADVLQKVPSVAVDDNGQVSLRGNASVTLYLDGKLAPPNLRLDQLPASRLETIEVITNPGAQYAAQGTGGIINLVQKKQDQPGWNGDALATVGTRDKYTASLSGNRQVGKFNFSGTVDGLSNLFQGSSALQQVATVAGRTTRTDQMGASTRLQTNHSLRLGVAYAFNDEQRVSLTAQYYAEHYRTTQDFATLLARDPDPTFLLRNQNAQADNVYGSRVSGTYRRTWAASPGRELTASASYYLDGGTVTTQQRVLDGPASYARNARQQLLDVTIQMPSVQVDYVHPLDQQRRWEVGVKTDALLTPGTSDYAVQATSGGEFVRQDTGSYRYTYRQLIPQAYGSYRHKSKLWEYQAGLRAEFTGLFAKVLPTGAVRQRILNVFPSATVARTLPHDQRLQLSYSRRVNRPNFLQLIPLPFYSDARNYVVGNVYLRPEYVHVAELGHQLTWRATTLNTTLFGRFASQSIQGLRTIDTLATRRSGQPDFITCTSYANFGHTASYGLELSLTQPVTTWWKLTANGSYYRNQVTSFTGDGTRANFTGTAYLLNQFSPTKTLALQLSGDYRAPLVVPQGRLLAVYGVDVALRQRLFHDRAALTLRVSDLFNTRRQYTQLAADGLATDLQTKYETRVGYLGLSWFLGTKKSDSTIEDQPRGDTGGLGG